MICGGQGKHAARDVIHLAFGYLIRGEQMVNCTKKQIRALRTALRWKIPVGATPAHPNGLAALCASISA
jgi:hypothetical protein